MNLFLNPKHVNSTNGSTAIVDRSTMMQVGRLCSRDKHWSISLYCNYDADFNTKDECIAYMRGVEAVCRRVTEPSVQI